MQTRHKIGILGATGVIGQRFIQLLEGHPWFEITWLAASDKSSGKTYGEATRWKLDSPLPSRIAAMMVSPAAPEGAPGIIFAALDTDIARELEPRFAAGLVAGGKPRNLKPGVIFQQLDEALTNDSGGAKNADLVSCLHRRMVVKIFCLF